MTNVTTFNPLFQSFVIGNRDFETSHKWRAEIRPDQEQKNFNQTIRNAETYAELIRDGHIIEVTRENFNRFGTDCDFQPVLKANYGNPIMLLSRVARNALEHHFEETAEQAVHSSKESAFLAAAGINLQLIASDPNAILSLQALSQAKEALLAVELVSKKLNEVESSIPRAIRQELTTCAVNVFPEGCLKTSKIAATYFKDINPEVVRKYLKYIGHPTKSYLWASEGGIVTTQVFCHAGLKEASERFSEEVIFEKTTALSHFYYHPGLNLRFRRSRSAA